MAEKEQLTYEERRRHINDLVHNKLEVPLTDICRWCDRGQRAQYQYVWQVLSGKFGKVKRSPKVLDDIERELRKRGKWLEYEV